MIFKKYRLVGCTSSREWSLTYLPFTNCMGKINTKVTAPMSYCAAIRYSMAKIACKGT